MININEKLQTSKLTDIRNQFFSNRIKNSFDTQYVRCADK